MVEGGSGEMVEGGVVRWWRERVVGGSGDMVSTEEMGNVNTDIF